MRCGLGALLLLPAILHQVVLTEKLNPKGKNVCMVEESFTVTVDVEEWYKQDYRTTKWCLKIPPRCTVYAWRWATRLVPKNTVKTRTVAQCCQGYIPNGPIPAMDLDCKAACAEPCRHGVCVLPNTCSCFPGFMGPQCQEICSRNTWGGNCSHRCDCHNDAFCNPMSGQCMCTPGWRGKRCIDPCIEGTFGFDCRRPCFCQNQYVGNCHHITGECFYSSTEYTTEFSTTITTELSTTEPASTPVFTTTEASTTSSTTASSESYTTTTEVTSTVTESSSTSEVTDSTSTSQPSSSSAEPTSASTEATSSQQTSSQTFLVSNVDFTTTPVITTTDLAEPTTETSSMYSPADSTGMFSTPSPSESGLTNLTGSSESTGTQELAGLAVTIALSVVGSIVLLCAAAGLALSRHRKLPRPGPDLTTPPSSISLYRFYAEDTLPVKPEFVNPTYGCGEMDLEEEKPNLQTFKLADDSFEAELRGILEAQYDHLPPPVSRTDTPCDHLYDEITSALDARNIHLYS